MRHRREWVTGAAVDRSGAAQYIVLIRAPGDPDETRARGGGAGRTAFWRGQMRPEHEPHWKALIWNLLRDGRPRTFNRLCVEIAGVTADVAAGKAPEQALWALVEDRYVEHTLRAPILFRARKIDLPSGARRVDLRIGA